MSYTWSNIPPTPRDLPPLSVAEIRRRRDAVEKRLDEYARPSSRRVFDLDEFVRKYPMLGGGGDRW